MTVKLKVGLAVLAVLAVATAAIYWPTGHDARSPDVLERLASVAERVGRTDAESVDVLSELVDDPVHRVAVAAVRAIGSGSGDLNSQALREVLAESESGVLRGAAAAALGKFKSTDFRLLADVMEKDKSPEARAGAAKGLGRLHDPAAADRLVEALTDPSAQVRHSAFVALGRTTALYLEFDPAAPPQTQAENIAAIRRALTTRGVEHTHGPGR